MCVENHVVRLAGEFRGMVVSIFFRAGRKQCVTSGIVTLVCLCFSFCVWVDLVLVGSAKVRQQGLRGALGGKVKRRQLIKRVGLFPLDLGDWEWRGAGCGRPSGPCVIRRYAFFSLFRRRVWAGAGELARSGAWLASLARVGGS